jgi:hypothetical protein
MHTPTTHRQSVVVVILPRAIFRDAKVIRKFGDVPDDLSAL